MKIINNVDETLRDDLSVEIKAGSKVSIAAACFSIYAFQELKEELQDIEQLRFVFRVDAGQELYYVNIAKITLKPNA